jgi:hypothetical protein
MAPAPGERLMIQLARKKASHVSSAITHLVANSLSALS